MDDDIDIKNIEIIINTNIGDDKEIIFSKNLLYIPNQSAKDFANFSNYPFITHSCKYPKQVLKNMIYIKRLKFFFIKSEFEKVIKENIKKDDVEFDDDYYDNYNADDDDEIDIKTKEKYMKRQNILKENVLDMLQLIFPTLYPYVGNINSSFENMKNDNSIFGASGSSQFNDYLNTLIVPKISYLNIENKIYTIIGVTWLDDVLNNPDYLKFITLMYEYFKWGEGEIKNFQKEKKTTQRKIKKAFDKFEIKKNSIITEIQKREALIPKDTNKLSSKLLSEKQKLSELKDVILNRDTFIIGIFYIITHEPTNYKIFAEYKGKNSDNKNIFKHLHCEDYNIVENNDVYSENQVLWNNLSCWILLTDIKPSGKILYKNLNTYLGNKTPKLWGWSGKIEKKGEKYNILLDAPYTEDINIPGVFKINDSTIEFSGEQGINELRKRLFIKKDQSIKKIKNIEEQNLEDRANNIVKIYESLENVSSSEINDSNFNTLIKTIKTEGGSFQELKTFAYEYLIHIKDGVETSNIRLYVKDSNNWSDRFEVFKKTIKDYISFMGDTIRSSNINLQKLIDDYGNNNDDYKKEMMEFIITIYEKKILNTSRNTGVHGDYYKLSSKYMNSGVTDINIETRNLPNYKIFVNLDLIDGELNSKNINEIQCLFQDNSLVERFDKLIGSTKKTWKAEKMPFIAIPKNTNEEQIKVKQGGTRRVRFLIGNRTRKLY